MVHAGGATQVWRSGPEGELLQITNLPLDSALGVEAAPCRRVIRAELQDSIKHLGITHTGG